MQSKRTNNFLESGRGLGHVIPTIFGIRSNISLKLFELETSNLIHGFVWAMPRRRANNFSPESGRGLGHVIPTIFGIRSNISLKLLELETSNLIHGFVWAMPRRRANNFSPESGRGLGHVTTTIFGSTVGYPSDSLASCTSGLFRTASLGRAARI